ncbi:hypothetical protein AYO49_00490 [Verrucomicrobiaceae bacterium SCGC AG-212-N21]|nr:hypothetical protein AYO49_00490 [Verrucomicrobiaceae bacterium SCGC AG-212-N21]
MLREGSLAISRDARLQEMGGRSMQMQGVEELFCVRPSTASTAYLMTYFAQFAAGYFGNSAHNF